MSVRMASVFALLIVGPFAMAGVSEGANAAAKPPLIGTNGVAVTSTCRGVEVHEHHVTRRVAGSEVRLTTGDGATLKVSLSRGGCEVAAASVELLNAPTGVWLSIGSPDVYSVGRLDLTCRASTVESGFQLDRGSATASVHVEAAALNRQTTLQPGQSLRGPTISSRPSRRPDGSTAAWTVQPGGEAGWTTARITETARSGCRIDIRALVTPFRS